MTAVISPGGLAMNPDGTLADLPRDLAHRLSDELLNVVTLMRAAEDTQGWPEQQPDADGLTSPDSRMNALLHMADVRIPRDPGHRSAVMADSIPP